MRAKALPAVLVTLVILVGGLVFVAPSTSVQAAAPPSGATFATGYVDLSVGYRGACGVKANGTVRCWGYNHAGELGSISAGYTTGTVPIVGITNATSVSVGDRHACVRLLTGQAKCWGTNGAGQLGNKSQTNSPTPVAVLVQDGTPLTSIQKIYTAKEGTCALLSNETVTCWGNGADGLLGDGTSDDRSYAGPTVGLTNVVSVSTTWDDNRACAVTRQGEAFCWGHEWSPSASNLSPVQKTGITDASSISAGQYHSCVITAGSTFKCWGGGTWQKQTGTTQVSGDIYTTPGLEVSSIINDGMVTCVVLVGATAKCWGRGWNGVLGTGNDSDRSTATSVKVSSSEILAGVERIEIGESLACALMSNTSIYCWGYSAYTARPWATSGTSETSYAGPISDSANAVLDSISFEKSLGVTGTSGLRIALSGIQYCTPLFEGLPEIQVEVGKEPDLSDSIGRSLGFFSSCGGVGPHTSDFSISQLKAATKYYYRVTVLSAYGNLVDEVRSFVSPGKIAVFGTNQTITRTQSSVKILLKYDSDGIMASTEKCFVSTVPSMANPIFAIVTKTGVTDELSCVANNLAAGTAYYFKVEIVNAVGTSDSGVIIVKTSNAPGITVNEGELYTNSPNVKISLTVPDDATSFVLSNDGGFSKGKTFSLAQYTVNWILATAGVERLPKTVYVRFIKAVGDAVTLTDDIILDTTAPALTDVSATSSSDTEGAVSVASVRGKLKSGVKMLVKASDTNSGIGRIEVRTSAKSKTTKIQYSNPKAKAQTVRLKTASKSLQVRVIDRAGNSSKWKDLRVR